METYYKKFTFPKIAFYGKRRINIPEVELRLIIKDDGKPVLSICGGVWNSKQTDYITCGQCLDTMKEFLHSNTLFRTLYKLWCDHHLNDMHAGTIKQEEALSKVEHHCYEDSCKYLESIGLLYDGDYKYGSSWLYRDIPDEDLSTIKSLLETKEGELS